MQSLTFLSFAEKIVKKYALSFQNLATPTQIP